ncbi:hypothetical protein K2173_012377 [Erythroxylum novogranatense]|uniref:RING-type E3 ubiquitin transferase n=1 Tax=Erythroxylum novogranatense TaxID=1862640 RepID=A0AAV8UEF3_9ROSI|nr:hypothetical protein K2173_012377 [Erythroxylum novogranatense]
MSRRVLCKFFAHGACLKGEYCDFSHDWKDPPNNICTYYQKGICVYGSRCRYEHVKPSRPDTFASSSSTRSNSGPLAHRSKTGLNGSEFHDSNGRFVPRAKPARNLKCGNNDLLEDYDAIEPKNDKPEDRPLCSLAAAGTCPRGGKCPHVHGNICPSCGKHCLHPFRPEESEEHLKMCEKKQKNIEALKRSEEIECNVCLDRVLSKTSPAERKFGLLSECDHPFCISCIRNWRSSSPSSGMDVSNTVKACPICRKISYFVVPSVVWYSSKEEKQEIIDNYKARLSLIDCKHFNFGNGNCPFGTSCFYKHTVRPGSYTWKYQRPPPRRQPPRRSNVVDMDALYDVFEHLMGEDELGFDADNFFDEDLTTMDMALGFMLMSMDSSDLSSDEEND